jgi:TonB family protein
MSTTKIPPPDPSTAPAPASPPRPTGGDLYDPNHWEDAYRNSEVFDAPNLLIKLEDELSKSRQREAFWISVIVHIVIGAIFWNSAYFLQFFPARHTLTSNEDWMKQRDTTFIELPSDAQRLTKRPQTDKISDKDRVATHSTPLDPNELKRIIEASRRGAQAQAPQPAQQAAQNAPGVQAPSAPRPEPTPQPQIAEVKPAPEGPKVLFGGSVSASTAVEQAARAAAANRVGGYGDGGTSFTQGRQGGAASSLDVLSDTMGVDFGPYLARVKHDVQINWYDLVPESARSPLFKQGKVAIQFAILKDGRVSAMQLAGSSNDVALDRAAWGGINGSNPFPPLPSDFKGEYLLLRFTFFYNPPNGVMLP